MEYRWWILAWLIYGAVFIGKELLARTRTASLKAQGFREKNPAAQLRHRRSRIVQGTIFGVAFALLEAIVSGLFHSGSIITVFVSSGAASLAGLYGYRVSLSVQNVGDWQANGGLKTRDTEWVKVAEPLAPGYEHGSSEVEPAAYSDLADPRAAEPTGKGAR